MSLSPTAALWVNAECSFAVAPREWPKLINRRCVFTPFHDKRRCIRGTDPVGNERNHAIILVVTHMRRTRTDSAHTEDLDNWRHVDTDVSDVRA